MSNSLQLQFAELVYTLAAILPAIVLHEMAHGYVSVWLGDETPRRQGRLSLNPLHHIEPVGLLCLALFKFGWAKPVQVNPRAYRNGKAGMVLVALAGPVMNILLCFLGCFVYALCWKTGLFYHTNLLSGILRQFLPLFLHINLGLGLFNLIPIPPLDGSKILGGFLPEQLYFKLMRYERYGMIVLIAYFYLSSALDFQLFSLASLRMNVLEWMLNTAFTICGVF